MQRGVEHRVRQSKDRDRGYEILFGVCTRCGEENAKASNRPYECTKCRSKDDFRQNSRAIPAKTVENIINRRSYYKCTKCGAEYDIPTPCCLIEEKAQTSKEGWQRAWMCMGCSQIFFKEIQEGECCSGHEVKTGKAQADPLGIKKQILGAI